MAKNPLYSISAAANVLNVIRLYGEARARLEGGERHRFSAVIRYMNERLSEDITLSELSERACMHPTYFVRRFGMAFSIPPMAYLNRLRIYKAMSYLTASEMSIEEISELVGIRDRSYFARLFKKHAGVTPTEYRAAFL